VHKKKKKIFSGGYRSDPGLRGKSLTLQGGRNADRHVGATFTQTRRFVEREETFSGGKRGTDRETGGPTEKGGGTLVVAHKSKGGRAAGRGKVLKRKTIALRGRHVRGGVA